MSYLNSACKRYKGSDFYWKMTQNQHRRAIDDMVGGHSRIPYFLILQEFMVLILAPSTLHPSLQVGLGFKTRRGML